MARRSEQTGGPVSRRELVALIDLIGAANERRLAGYCEARLSASLGPEWMATLARRRRAERRPELGANAGVHDPRFVLACFAFEPEFEELGDDARVAARKLNGIANAAFHHDAASLRPGDLDRARSLLKTIEAALRRPARALGLGMGWWGTLVDLRLVGGPLWHGPAAVVAAVALAIVLIEIAGVDDGLANALAWVAILAWGLATRTLVWAGLIVIAYVLIT